MASITAWQLGLVVPKRFARRSVTRSLIKRQMRQALRERVERLPAGAWVLRLKAPVQVTGERSAVTEALRERVRAELGELLDLAERQSRRALAQPVDAARAPGAGPARRAKGSAKASPQTPADASHEAARKSGSAAA